MVWETTACCSSNGGAKAFSHSLQTDCVKTPKSMVPLRHHMIVIMSTSSDTSTVWTGIVSLVLLSTAVIMACTPRIAITRLRWWPVASGLGARRWIPVNQGAVDCWDRRSGSHQFAHQRLKRFCCMYMGIRNTNVPARGSTVSGAAPERARSPAPTVTRRPLHASVGGPSP